MTKIYPLIDDEPPSKRDTVFIRILVWLADLYNTIFYRTHVPVFDFLCSVYLYRSKKGYKLRWIIRIPAYFCILVLIGVSILTPLMVREMVISVAPWTYVRTARAAEVNHKPLTIEDYICTKEWDCKTAVAIAKAESGLRCDAQNVNKGTNSLDLGVMQINSVHLKKGWKVADLLDCHKNIDLAYEIYKGSGWGAWSTYNNKSFKRFL